MSPRLQKISLRPTQSTVDGINRRLVFRAVFSEEVQNVDTDDFTVTGGSNTVITSLEPASNGNPRSFDITVEGGDLDTFSGKVGVDLVSNPTITSLDNKPLARTGHDVRLDTFTVGDPNAPSTPINNAPRLERIVENNGQSSVDGDDRRLVFRAVFSEEVKDIDPNDFIVTGGTSAIITSVGPSSNGNPRAFDILVENGDLDTFDGTVGLRLAENRTINSLTNNVPIAEPAANIRLDTFTLSGRSDANDENQTSDENDSTSSGGEDQSSGDNNQGSGGEDQSSGNNNQGSGGESQTSDENNQTSGNLEGILSAITETNVLEITEFGTSEALSLTVDVSKIVSVGSLTIFSTDANGTNRQQIAAFSVVENENSVIPDFNPQFRLLRSDLEGITHLQFELEEKGFSSVGLPAVLADGSLSLSFKDGTQLSAALEETVPGPQILVDDAQSIDLTDFTGDVNISGSIYREAQLNNVVDLYVTNDEGAVFDSMGNKFMPGDEGYQEVAVANRLNINLTGTNGQVQTFNTTLTGNQRFGIFVAVDGVEPAIANESEIFFSYSGANITGTSNQPVDHFRSLGDNTFGIEDQAGLGDSDFNDLMISFEIV